MVVRRVWAVTFTAVLPLGAGACGEPGPSVPDAGGGCDVAVDRAPAAGECTLVDWDVVGLTGSSIEIEYLANDPGCSLDLDRIEVDETDASVSVRVVLGFGGDDGAACPTAIGTRAATVTLSAPLGDRRLLGCRPEGSFAPAGGYDAPEPRDPEIDCTPGATP